MKGADYIAEFLARNDLSKVFVLTGGACAFMIDAVARHKQLSYHCFHHEQSAAMAADALWRTSRRVGVTMATSGPGAVNLLTGIACSYFDSIPTLHITGQVNLRESAGWYGAAVRQAGFQETKIAEIARPLTKYAVQVRTGEELKRELPKALWIAMTGRRGPVLIDVPIDLQQQEIGEYVDGSVESKPVTPPPANIAQQISSCFAGGERPLVLFGAGVGLAGAEASVTAWLTDNRLPFVASWNALTYFDHDLPTYCGQIGVYGNRGANYLIQNCDRLLVLGSRLDNRQRSGNARTFARGAHVLVLDIDEEELKKYRQDGYAVAAIDLSAAAPILKDVAVPRMSAQWKDYVADIKAAFFRADISQFSRQHGTLSPYAVIRRLNDLIDRDAIVVTDTGATVCWVHQMFHRTRQTLFTAGGNSPMGYALPAAIGAAIEAPHRQIVCITGDGGFQLNIQELQTIRSYGLKITIIVMNNAGYGIIKQFQDSYLAGRYEASGAGYGVPNFGGLSEAYGLAYKKIATLSDMDADLLQHNGGAIIDVILHPLTPIEPKLEMGHPIHDQFPYVDDAEFARVNRFVPVERTPRS